MLNYLKENYEDIKKTGLHPLPKIIAIESTYGCNLSCSICFYKKKYSSKKELSAKNFIDFLEKIPVLKSVYFPAREPLFKNDFFEMTDYLSKRKIPMLVLTNGTLINKKNYSKLVYDKKNMIMTSIDGEKELHNRMRGSIHAFDKVTKSIKLLKDKCNLYIVCIISEENLDGLWRIPKIISQLGLNRVIFEYERKYTKKDIKDSLEIIQSKKGFSDLKISKINTPIYSLNELKSNIEKMEIEARKYKVNVGYLPTYFKEEMSNIYYRKLRKKRKLFCCYLDKVRIDPEGNCMHCFAFRKSFGNIINSSLEEIWFSSEYKNFRKRLLKNNLMPICETCWGAIPIDYKKEIIF